MHYIIKMANVYYKKTRRYPYTDTSSEATQWKTLSGAKKKFEERKQEYRDFLEGPNGLPNFNKGATYKLLSVEGSDVKVVEEEHIRMKEATRLRKIEEAKNPTQFDPTKFLDDVLKAFKDAKETQL